MPDQSKYVHVLACPAEFAYPLSKLRGGASLLEIFTSMIDEDLIRHARALAESSNPSVWSYSTTHRISTTIGFFLQVIATTVRIIGLQPKPSLSEQTVKEPQKEAISAARDHFTKKIR